MPLLSKPAFGPRTAITYITIGSLIAVWTAVWYFTLARGDDGTISRDTWFWLAGLFLTGLTLIVIGVLVGEIGRRARKAEMPPQDAQYQEATIQETAAANPGPIVTGGMVDGLPVTNAAPMPGAPGVIMPAPPAWTRQQSGASVPGATLP